MRELENIRIPRENVNDEYVVINSILYKNGDKISKGDIIATIETSKTDFSIEASFDGYIYYDCNEGDELEVGASLAKIFDSIQSGELNEVNQNTSEDGLDKVDNKPDLKFDSEFSKSASELVAAHNIPKSVFAHKPFVSKDDVLSYLKANRTVEKSAGGPPSKETLPQNIQVEKISSTKKREISYLGHGQNAGLTCTFSINIDNEGVLDYARKNHRIFRLTILPTLISEISKLLEKFPILNAYFENDQIIKYNDINIGYAVDIEHGLKVITLYKCNTLSVPDLEKLLSDKFESYSKQTLEISDLTNSTFTVTDLSKSGIHYFKPLINKNQAAILGISSVNFKTNSFNISVTFDHRVTEGKTVAAFLNALRNNMEKYYKESRNYINRRQESDILLKKITQKIAEGNVGSDEILSYLKQIVEMISEKL